MTRIQKFHSFYIGADVDLTREQVQQMVSCFEISTARVNAVLGGRAAVTRTTLPGIGPVVVKQYTRGGIIRRFNKTFYLNFSRYRSQCEHELLKFLYHLGVSVPVSIAFARRGFFFYQAWLITKEIKNAITLADAVLKDPDRVRAVMPDLSRQVEILIENQIHHVDLHPGNVLVTPENRLYLIDFDKARTTPVNRRRLREKYIRRWQRAVLKYRLPAFLNTILDNRPADTAAGLE